MAPKEQLTTRRALHLVDADNLLADPLTIEPSAIRGTLAAYRRAARFALGITPSWRRAQTPARVRGQDCVARRPAPPARWVGRGGPCLAGRARGDGPVGVIRRCRARQRGPIFLVALDVLRSVDVEVVVVSRRDALARALRVMALAVTDLDLAGAAA